MHERPQAALFAALRELGYRVESANDRIPVTIHGGGRRVGIGSVSMAESSQFASALLLCAQAGGWQVEVLNENAEEAPYVAMTRELAKVFPAKGGRFQIEPDASSGSYFWAVNALIAGAQISVRQWPASGWQVDERFPRCLPLPARLSRLRDLGDSIMTAIVLAPFADHPVSFVDLGRLRVQECERVFALRTELTKCGARVEEVGDTLAIWPSQLHGAEIETYNDHRMAMCFAILGLKVPGIRIQNPACVRKTFPNFFQKLAAAPPHGLGAELYDPQSRRRLGGDDLFAS
jgi:3-phosphoshikimate 1-carboxyvinyltransferase